MTQYAVSPSMITAELAAHSLRTVTGKADNADGNAVIHVNVPYTDLYELSELIVFADPVTGQVIKLRDVARLERRYQESSQYIQYSDTDVSNNRCLIFSMEMRPGNNIVAFGDEVNEIIDAFLATAPPDINVHRITDMPDVVNKSVHSFLKDLVEAIIIVILVMLFLFPLRTALVSSTSVPVCIAATWAIMYLIGIELNTVTLAALIVVLSMLIATCSVSFMFFPMLSLLKGTNLADSLTKILQADSRVKSVTAFIGLASPRFHITYAPEAVPTSAYAQFIVNTVSEKATKEIVEVDLDIYEAIIFPQRFIQKVFMILIMRILEICWFLPPLLPYGKTKFNTLLFASVSVPLTKWWETSNKLKEHELKIREAELMQEDLEGKMALQEKQAFNQMVEAEALLRSDRAALAMAEENSRLANLNYQAGMNTISDVLEANALLLQAQNAITDRQITYASARRRYHDLTGN